MTNKREDAVIKIQADNLCIQLGLEPGTYLDLKLIREVASKKSLEIIKVNGKEIKVSLQATSLAGILLEKLK